MPYRDFKSVAELSSYQALALSVAKMLDIKKP